MILHPPLKTKSRHFYRRRFYPPKDTVKVLNYKTEIWQRKRVCESAVACNPWDKARKAPEAGADGFPRWWNKERPKDNAQRDKKNEFSPFHKVLFIGNYSQVLQTVYTWKKGWHHFTSPQARINKAEVNVRAVQSQLSPILRCSIIQTQFLHNLFPCSFVGNDIASECTYVAILWRLCHEYTTEARAIYFTVSFRLEIAVLTIGQVSPSKTPKVMCVTNVCLWYGAGADWKKSIQLE